MKQILLFVLIITTSIGCKKKNYNEKPKQANTERFQSVIDSIYKSMPEYIGILAHIESPTHGISWSGSSGYSNREKTSKLLPDQPVLIASNIKTYVAASILRLQEEGKLNIEDPIVEHLSKKTAQTLKDDAYKIEEIKIKHLLSHTSGIADYVNDEYLKFINNNQTYRWSRDEQIKLSTKVGDPLGNPQDVFNYADINYLLATEIIEQKTGQAFYKAMRELLKYEDLNLYSTWFPTLEEKPAHTKELAHQYWKEDNWGASKLNFDWDSYEHDISWDLFGGGGIATTINELAQFSYDLFKGKIITDQNILDLMSKDVPTADGIPKIYRLGVADATINGLQSLGHGGFWGSQAFYIPQLDASISVCVLERKDKMKAIRSLLSTLLSELAEYSISVEHTITDKFKLYKPKDAKACLIVFPGGADTSTETIREFNIITAATANQIAVLYMNFNRHLWIDPSTTQELSVELENIFSEHDLKTDNVYIGGMSVGGNVALTLAEHFTKEHSLLTPKGVFIVDSPIDLYALYESSLKDVANSNFDEDRLAEPKWIINSFEKEFGKDSLLHNIVKVSPFTLKRNHTSIPSLQSTKLRFYTEPDSLWVMKNRQTDFKSTNAYTIQQIAKDLQLKQWNKFELIETKNKGYRADGEKNPHSWSIVDIRKLIEWINKDKQL